MMRLRRLNRWKKSNKTLIKVIRTKENSVFGVADIYYINLLSHLSEHKFMHNFNDTVNPKYNCGAATERTIHYLMLCWHFSVQIAELLNGIYKLDSTLQNSSQDQLLTVLLYGSERFPLNVNKKIIRLTINYWKASERFFQLLFWPKMFIYFFSFYLFLYYFFVSYCTGLTITDYILHEFCALFVHSFRYYFSYLLLLLVLQLLLVKILDIYIYIYIYICICIYVIYIYM